MIIRPSVPWFYLLWKQPALSAEQELAIARMARREGLFAMMRIYWQVVTKESDDRTPYFDLACAWAFFARNYPPFLCVAGYLIGLQDIGVLGIAWGATFAYGSLREMAWLLSLLYRWPPVAKS